MGEARPLIRLENVHKRFDLPVLAGAELSVPQGSLYGLVGPGASGKSVALKLLSGLMRPDSGRVIVAGRALEQLDDPALQEYQRGIGMLFQNNALFDFMTVAENIAFGHPEATRAAIERAAKSAGAHEFIRTLPKGYDTPLEEGAVNLSGGQRQRLAIARPLLLEPAILLLDDPTTAVDPDTEHEVLTAIDAAMRGRTTIVVANRLSTLRRVDRILVLHEHRIVESGTHRELMALRGLYFRAASLQAPDSQFPPAAELGAGA